MPSACSVYKRTTHRRSDVSHHQRKEISLPHVQRAASFVSQQAMENSNQEKIKIASVSLSPYKPDEISLEVDNGKINLHGLHRYYREQGFRTSELKRFFKLPEDVNPATVTSRISENGGVLIIEGMKYAETKIKDRRFQAKLDFRGFKPEEIKIQLRRNELTVTGKRISEDHLSHAYSRRILLPDDVDLGSVTSQLSKEGLLSIEASTVQQKTFEVNMETSDQCEEPSTAELFALVV